MGRPKKKVVSEVDVTLYEEGDILNPPIEIPLPKKIPPVNIYKEVDKKVVKNKSEKDILLGKLQNDLAKAKSNIIEPRGSSVFEGKIQLVNYIEALIIDLKR